MRAHIENDLYISGDGLGFTIDRFAIKQIKIKGTEEYESREVYETVKNGNFTTLHGAVKGLLTLKVQESTAATLNELLQEVQAYKAFIESKIEV